MSKITIWHNPRCSKSRAALTLLEESNKKYDIYKYLNENPTYDDISLVLKKLSIEPRDLMRTKEDIYKELNLEGEKEDDKLIKAMSDNPKLIERPIVIVDEKAVIGRPLENISEILK